MVFTEYADTVEWIVEFCTPEATARRLAVIQGSTSPEDREYIRSQFTADPYEGAGSRAARHRRRG